MDGASILWTAMPVELVVDGLEPAAHAVMEVQVEGRRLQVLPGTDGTGLIQRLLSTDPQDFLDPRFQPGTQIPLNGAGALL